MLRNYHCIVLEDCTAEPIGQGLPRSNKEASLLFIETHFGWVWSTSAVADSLARHEEMLARPR